MLYVLRLSSGDSIVAAAEDENRARALAESLRSLEEAETIASARPLSAFAVRLSPTDRGALEVNQWDDSTLDDILGHEYPILKKALDKANSVPFLSSPNREEPVLDQLKTADHENAETIRRGLRQEIERLGSEPTIPKNKTAHS
jgi:hypothetical protein